MVNIKFIACGGYNLRDEQEESGEIIINTGAPEIIGQSVGGLEVNALNVTKIDMTGKVFVPEVETTLVE